MDASYDRKRQAITTKGRNAITFWQILRQFPPFGSHIECKLETGRTHQIRVHLAHIGHGIIGDPLYGRAPRAAQMPDNVARSGLSQMRKFERQALHAAHLGFAHPVTGEALTFETKERISGIGSVKSSPLISLKSRTLLTPRVHQGPGPLPYPSRRPSGDAGAGCRGSQHPRIPPRSPRG